MMHEMHESQLIEMEISSGARWSTIAGARDCEFLLVLLVYSEDGYGWWLKISQAHFQFVQALVCIP